MAKRMTNAAARAAFEKGFHDQQTAVIAAVLQQAYYDQKLSRDEIEKVAAVFNNAGYPVSVTPRQDEHLAPTAAPPAVAKPAKKGKKS
jgi:hypothetical protein